MLRKCYDEVKRVYEMFELSDDDIWNLDESGVNPQGKSSGRVIGERALM
jgi:hypothetical protein